MGGRWYSKEEGWGRIDWGNIRINENSVKPHKKSNI